MGCMQIKASSDSSPNKVMPMVATPTQIPPTLPAEPKTASQRKEIETINAEFASVRKEYESELKAINQK